MEIFGIKFFAPKAIRKSNCKYNTITPVIELDFASCILTAIVILGFASSDYCINLHSGAPHAINGVIAYLVEGLTGIFCSISDNHGT